MSRKLVLLGFFLFNTVVVFSQLRSPDEFLGYKTGTRFTPHWKIVSYFQSVAANASASVKLEQYGQTNEGRSLVAAFVSSADNISRLDQIRMNNLRLANMARDKAAPLEANAPAIVWLSYNVHGNEASSSEAAMMTLWALVDPSNSATKEWLKNTVVVIDPCINPDGRDRYINWFNTVVGKTPNPAWAAREHREPWPGGRTNHYNFDLNRDWAWQTQIESQQRVKLYSQWMPQVHVDYHEQEYNNPYYFAPAAQPFHEVITPWQRDFQGMIGKNHAKYFDANGWLYFTKEVFDLLYPSYGDTYPTYNGAIGMTYEQAGHGFGGLAVITDEGDTLTLLDRATHHYTTALSTIEVASQHAGKLISEFRKYFNEAVATGIGEFKSYVVKYSEADRERVNALTGLLDKNGIRYEVQSGSTRGTMTGYNYFSGKDELFTVDNYDLLVQAQQPKSALVKVLFEPKTKLVDSATYDITAWSLPYVYGLKTYGSRSKLSLGGGNNLPVAGNSIADSYGYVIRWQGVQSARTLGQLFQKGVRVRMAEEPFDVSGQHFERGSLIITRKGNERFGNSLAALLNQTCNDNNVKLSAISTGLMDKGFDLGSEKVHPLNAPKIALLTGEGVSGNSAGEIWHFFDQVLEYPVTLINAIQLGDTRMADYNVIIMTSGNYKFLNDKAALEKLKDWISNGGRLVAMEGGVAQLAKLDWAIKAKKTDDSADKKDSYDLLNKYEERERDMLKGSMPGSIYRIELDNSHPLAYGYPDFYYTLKQDDNMYEFFKEGGWNVGVMKKEQQVAGYVGSGLRNKLKDGVVFGVQDMGDGRIVYLADDVLFRSFWENGKLMFCNAVFIVGQ